MLNIRLTSDSNHGVLSSKYHEIVYFGVEIFHLRPVDRRIFQYQRILRGILRIPAVNLSRQPFSEFRLIAFNTFCSRVCAKLQEDLSFLSSFVDATRSSEYSLR